MPESRVELTCPHCGERLKAFALPDGTGWDAPVQWACFNDDCPYFKDGWDWMWEHYRAKASYRYRVVNAETGKSSPLAVWSPNAVRDRIIEDPE
jgi:hypothetical protein